jgi:hypothetical protein
MGWNRTSSARGTPFGNKDRAAEFYSAVVSISEWLCPASLDHRLHQYGMECIRWKRQKVKAHIVRALRLGTRRSCFVQRYLSRSLIQLSTEHNQEKKKKKRWRAARSIDIRLLFHSRSAPSLACIASTMASLSLAPPLWLLPLLITGLSTSQPHGLQRRVHAARPVPCRFLEQSSSHGP